MAPGADPPIHDLSASGPYPVLELKGHAREAAPAAPLTSRTGYGFLPASHVCRRVRTARLADAGQGGRDHI